MTPPRAATAPAAAEPAAAEPADAAPALGAAALGAAAGEGLARPGAGVRRLPVAVAPATGETLRSWLDRLAADLRVPLGLLLASTGLTPEDSHDHVPTGYGLALAPAALASLAHATGQTEKAVRALLLTSWDGLAADLSGVDPAVPDTFRAAAAREWVYATGSHCCPACLRETVGIWLLAWRLPWSFACARHNLLLVDTCPGCGQRPQDARRDGRSGPAFTSRIPEPGLCDNPLPAGQGRLGRAGAPCGTDLAAADHTRVDHPLVLAAQHRLDTALQHGTAALPGGTQVPAQAYLADLRALVSVLLSHADTTDLHALLGAAPTRRRPGWAPDTLAAAWHDHLDRRADRADRRDQLASAGVDPRRGPRARLFERAPDSAALMALLCAAAVPALDAAHAGTDRQATAALAPFAAAGRRGNHPGLPRLLAARNASPRLRTAADRAARATGRFVTAAGLAHDISRPHPPALVPSHVPALLWPDEWPAFAPLFAGTGTRPDTARRFTSTALVKALAPLTWAQAGEQLGWPAASTRTLAANVVNRLNQAGTAQEFHAALADLADRLRTGHRPLTDHAARRRALTGLTAVPARVLHGHGLPVTAARRRNAAAWLWGELTSGSPHHAPAWNGPAANDSEKEVYRRFVRRDLPAFEPALRTHAAELLARFEPIDNARTGR